MISNILIVFCIVYLCFYCIAIVRYKYIQYKITNLIDKEEQVNYNTKKYNNAKKRKYNTDIDRWIGKNENKITILSSALDENQKNCEGLVVEVDNNSNNDSNNICKELSGKFCDSSSSLKRIDIPADTQIDLISDSGVKLLPGKSYCVYKEPPINNNNTSNNNNNNNNF